MRFLSVDAVRGLAALVVLAHHCALSFYDGAPGSLRWALAHTPLRLLVDGPAAVLIFFVVSGFALAASLQARAQDSAKSFSYPKYAAGRLVRIYPPFAVAVLASAALCVAVQPNPIASLNGWFNTESWAYPVTPGMIAGHLLMDDQHRHMTLLNPMWALIHILRISLLFPLLFFPLRARPILTMIAIALISAGTNYALSQGGLSPVVQTLCGTAQYFIVFAAGAAIFLARDTIVLVMRWGRGFLAIAALALGIGLLLAPRDPPILDQWIPGLASTILVALAVGSPTAVKVLSGRVLVWLGAISYSLYLVHMPVLLTVFHLWRDKAPGWVLVCIVIAASFVCAELMHRFVETPFVALSRRWGGAAKPS